MARDARADGRFVYAVGSTGIYCRPSCASRRPRRNVVTFFAEPDAAERAGYRACRRCRPSDAAATQDPWAPIVARACDALAREDGERLTLQKLSTVVHRPALQLQRHFTRIVGLSPRQYASALKMARVKRSLKGGAAVTTALYDAGFGSSSRLYEQASSRLGMTPRAYARGGEGLELRYATAETAIGRVLVASTARGICAIRIGRDAASLVGELRDEFPRAAIVQDDGQFATAVKQIRDSLEGHHTRIDLPLDVQATAFQWQVWRALTAIPYGSTRTYGEVAAAIGRPRATRAVARACATNPVALAIPCHRVVPASGGTGGYRWGSARKKQLLAIERRSMEH